MSRNRAFLVQADQPRIADHVGHENSREPADDPFGHVTLCTVETRPVMTRNPFDHVPRPRRRRQSQMREMMPRR
jgi:hypothetical protein